MNSAKIVSIVVVLSMILTGFVGVITISSNGVKASDNVGQNIPETSGVTRGKYWTNYGNGTTDRPGYPINYWNAIDGAWLPIDTNIYANSFNSYEWKNAKNSFDVYFDAYSVENRTKVVFYNVLDGVSIPSEISFSLNSVYWGNTTSIEQISSLIYDEGNVSGSQIVYNSFTDCNEYFKIGRSGLVHSLVFDDIVEPIINNVSEFVIEGSFVKDSGLGIYINDVLWNESGVCIADSISFGFSNKSYMYMLDDISVFDSDKMFSSGEYNVWSMGSNVYGYRVIVSYDYMSNVNYPVVVDPAWFAVYTDTIDFNNSNWDSTIIDLNNKGTEDRYDESSIDNTYIVSDEVNKPIEILKATTTSAVGYSDTYSTGTMSDHWDAYTAVSNPSGHAQILVRNGYTETINDNQEARTISTQCSKYVDKVNNQDVLRKIEFTERFTIDYYERVNYVLVYNDFLDTEAGVYVDDLLMSYGSYTTGPSIGLYYSGNLIKSFGISSPELLPTFSYSLTFDYIGHWLWLNVSSSYNSEFYSGKLSLPIAIKSIDWIRNRVGAAATSNNYLFLISYRFDNLVETYNTVSTYKPSGSINTDYFDFDNDYIIKSSVIYYNDVVNTAWHDAHPESLGYIYVPAYTIQGMYVVYKDEIGFIFGYDSLDIDTTQPSSTDVKVYVEYFTGSTWALVPNVDLPGNSLGFDGEGMALSVDMSKMDISIYKLIMFDIHLSSTVNTKTSSLDYLAVNMIKAIAGGATSTLTTNLVSLEPAGSSYVGNGTVRIGLGDTFSKWVSDPYVRLYWKRAVTMPEVNEAGWNTITDDIYWSNAVPNNWVEVTDSSNIRLRLNSPNGDGKWSYLWLPAYFTASYTDYWFKALVQDVSFADTVNNPTVGVYIISSAQQSIVANQAPTAIAGAPVFVDSYVNYTFYCNLSAADGGVYYEGEQTLKFCEWKFTGPESFLFIQNRTVVTNADGLVKLYFPKEGVYLGQLTLWDDHDLFDIDYVTITVTNSDPRTIWGIQGEAEPFDVAVARAYYYDARGSFDPDGSITMYSWSWGDGTWTNKTPAQGGDFISHTYLTANTYTVALLITDDSSNTNISAKEVRVIVGLPFALIGSSVGSDISGTAVVIGVNTRLTVTGGLSSTSSGSIDQYKWDWGDGYNSSTSDAISSHVYTIIGRYLVILTVHTTLDYEDDNFIYVEVIESSINDTGGGDILAMGVNPRFAFNVSAETAYLEVNVEARLIKEGWGGAWMEKYVSKEQVEVRITRTEGPLTLSNATTGNGTSNITYSSFEVFILTGTYFDAPINTGKMSYTGSMWDNLYVYVMVDGVWTLTNKASPSGVTVTATSGELQFKFTSEWDEVLVLTNPGFFKKIGNSIGFDADTPKIASTSIESVSFEALWKEN